MSVLATPGRLKLYELPQAFRQIETEIDELDGELPEDLEARLDLLEVALEDKADAIAALVTQAKAESEMFEAEAGRLTRRRVIAANRADRLKAYLHQTLTLLRRDRVVGRRFTVRVQRNGAPSIKWTRDIDALPPEFMKITVDVDAAKAREAFKAGTLPDGFEGGIGTHLRIV